MHQHWHLASRSRGNLDRALVFSLHQQVPAFSRPLRRRHAVFRAPLVLSLPFYLRRPLGIVLRTAIPRPGARQGDWGGLLLGCPSLLGACLRALLSVAALVAVCWPHRWVAYALSVTRSPNPHLSPRARSKIPKGSSFSAPGIHQAWPAPFTRAGHPRRLLRSRCWPIGWGGVF